MIKLAFNTEPMAVQSFRFTKQGRKYQPAKVKKWKQYIAASAISQLPGHKPFSGAVRIKVDFIFAVPKSYPKKLHNEVAQGIIRYKTKKPDLTDNLMKGLIDALSGVLWESDQLICKVQSRKVYGSESRIIVDAEEIDEIAEDNTAIKQMEMF